jgi:signal peptidase I
VSKLAFFQFGKKKEEVKEPEEKLSWQQSLVVDLKDLFHVLAIFMTIYMLFFRIVVVVGPSMYDTLVDGDRLLLISSTVYTQPKQGDIIVASKRSFANGECIVKRVIATEEQKVDINFETGVVYVDDEPLVEDYIYSSTTLFEGVTFPLIVEKGHVFVLGDNRANSKDSRSPQIGQIDKREILGKAIFLLSPGTHGGTEQAQLDRFGVIN